MISIKNRNFIYYLLYISIVLIIVLRANAVTIPDIFLIAASTIICFFLRREEILFVVIISVVLSLWLPSNYIIVGAFAVYCIRYVDAREGFHCSIEIVFLIFFFLSQLFAVIYEDGSIIIWLKAFTVEFAFVYLLKIPQTKDVAVTSMKLYITCVMVLSMIALQVACRFAGFDTVMRIRLGYTNMQRYLPNSIVIPNENGLACYIATAMLMLIVLYLRRHIKNTWVFALQLAYLMLILLVTKSRTGILISVLGSILLLLSKKGENGWRRLLPIMAIIMVLGAVTYICNFTSVFSNAFERFRTADITNGRLDIFMRYNRIWASKPRWILFGMGNQIDPNSLGERLSVHTAFQSYYVYYGVVGAFLFLLFFVNYVRSFAIRASKSCRFLLLIPFFVALLGNQGGSDSLLSVLLPLLMLNIDEQEKKKLRSECYEKE